MLFWFEPPQRELQHVEQLFTATAALTDLSRLLALLVCLGGALPHPTNENYLPEIVQGGLEPTAPSFPSAKGSAEEWSGTAL